MERFFIFAALCLLPHFLLFGEGAPLLQGVDIYGTDRISADDIRQKFGRQIDQFAGAMGQKSKAKAKAAEEQRAKLESGIRQQWGLAWVHLSWMDFYEGSEHRAFITVDVVEPKDRRTRLAFRQPPPSSMPDPAGLLAAWGQYQGLGWSLFRKGDIQTGHGDCPAFYCNWTSETPELKAFETRFAADVPAQKEELAEMMLRDRDADVRAEAVYLLSYLPDGTEVSKIVADALRDPDSSVRSAALDVYTDIVVYHKQVRIPLEKLYGALDDPLADCRSKALAVMAGLADNPDYRPFLINKAADRILRLMKQGQPAIGDTAYAAIGILSKETYDRKETAVWERWLDKAKAAEAGSPGAASPP